MSVIIYDQFEQGSDLWLRARMGMPTTSRFKTVAAKGTKDERSVTRDRYICDLAAELITGNPCEQYVNRHMERGNLWEPDALAAYILKTNSPIKRVAFIRNDEIGAGGSPDGLVGDRGGVEIKTLLPGLMVKHLRGPGVPPDHIAQLQGLMWVTGRQWWDLVIYSPGFDIWVERVYRDETWIQDFKRFLEPFKQELADVVFAVTDETLATWRKRRDADLTERMNEDRTFDAA